MTSTRVLRIATRSSELALRQARLVAERLLAAGVQSELVTYKTVGDTNLAQPLAEIGAKGLFTQELEADLSKGKVDCCVHSLKDLPTTMPTGLVIAALIEREDPRDVLVVNHLLGADSLDSLPRGSRVGTSSLRRRAQLLATRDDLEIVDLRGNVPTRVRKVDEGQVHAAILAAAGLHRLGIIQRITAYLEPPAWLPAAGQGAIAVQTRGDDVNTHRIVSAMNDRQTEIQTHAERSFLAALDGGCQVPIGALAVTDGPPILHGFISDIEGRKELRGSVPLDVNEPRRSGEALARELRRRGATEILAGLKRVDGMPSPQPE